MDLSVVWLVERVTNTNRVSEVVFPGGSDKFCVSQQRSCRTDMTVRFTAVICLVCCQPWLVSTALLLHLQPTAG